MTRISIAGLLYFDRTQPLMDHSAGIPELDYDYTVLSALDLGRRVFLDAEFDAGELWAASYITDVAAGRSQYVGLPIFPSRVFRHSFVFVRQDSGIAEPADLAGKRVGVVEYVQTAGVWIRAFLQHDYGVSPADINWTVTRQRTHAPVPPPRGLSVTTPGDGRSLERLLHDGAVEAAIGALNPRTFLGGPVRRLFTHPREVETEYYRRTKLFPIMHIVGLRRDIYEAHPELAMKLVRLYEEAKQIGRARLMRTASLAVTLPWLEEHLRETEAVFGGDPFSYGFERNKYTIERLTEYVFEQGLTNRKVSPEELFAAETLGT